MIALRTPQSQLFFMKGSSQGLRLTDQLGTQPFSPPLGRQINKREMKTLSVRKIKITLQDPDGTCAVHDFISPEGF